MSNNRITKDDSHRRDRGGAGGESGIDSNQTGDSAMTSLLALQTDQKVALAGTVIAALGSFLPWATFLGISISGLQASGDITLGLAVIAAVVTVLEPVAVRKWNNAIVGGCGVLIVLIGVLSLTSLAAIGLYLTILGGLVVAFPQFRHLYRRYQSTAV